MVSPAPQRLGAGSCLKVDKQPALQTERQLGRAEWWRQLSSAAGAQAAAGG